MKILLVIFIFSISLFANIGVVKAIKGTLTINRQNRIIYAKVGEKIFQLDKLDTYKKSKVKIILNDDTTITLGENTNYIINSYDDAKNPHLEMALSEGLAHIISGKIGKLAPKKFKLRTKTSLIGIRGTEWQTYIHKKTQFNICIKGSIYIEFLKKIRVLKAGQMLYIKGNKARRFKTNRLFFNKIIKAEKIDKKLPKKVKVVKKTIPYKTQVTKVKLTNSKLSTDVKIKNIDIGKNGSAKIGGIEMK